MSQRIAVIGGVAAGPAAAAEAVRADPGAEVVLFERGDVISYGACEMPYYVADQIHDHRRLVVLSPAEFERTRGARVCIRHDVTSIDPEKGRLTVRHDGREDTMDFDRFILATGAHARMPDLDGIAAQNVFPLRRLSDALDLKRYLDEHDVEHAVVLGAGYVGMESAEALRHRRVRVTLLEPAGRPLPEYVEGDICDVVEETVLRHGVTVRAEAATRLEVDDQNRVRFVETSGGERIGCQLVVAAMGVVPSTDLALRSGARAGETGALDVDDGMRTGLPNIWACGDVVEVRRVVDGKKVHSPLAPTAFRTARVAARNAVGGDATFPGVCPASAVRVFGLEVAAVGLKLQEAETAGFDAFAADIRHTTRVGMLPGAKPIWVRLVVERATGRLLGAALAAEEGAAHRADVLIPLVREGWTVRDLLDVDLIYTPPVAPSHDPLLVAASRALKELS